MDEIAGETSGGYDHVSQSFEDDYVDTDIVVGLVGAVGTQLSRVVEVITDRLKAFNYTTREIHVSGDVIGVLFDDIPSKFASEYDRISTFIEKGNRAREISGDNSILALGVSAEMFRERDRDEQGTVKPKRRVAYIVNSLKHPQEVTRLRSIYADGFYLIGVHSNKDTRRDYLIRQKNIDSRKAEELIERDEDEVEGHGQHTRNTFHLADFFIHLGNDEARWRNSVLRILDLVFGHPFITPTFDEYAMFMAFTSALRSADLSRQIGAVIARDNEIIATGANDCPRAGGGLYWPDYNDTSHEYVDKKKGRDYTRGGDSNRREQKKIIEGILNGLDKNIDKAKVEKALQASKIGDLTEYGRVVHAEMEALLFCARNAVDARDATLYTTTFPCHNCAKHIIAAGIRKVVYVEPYPKSKAIDFHDDAITQEESANSHMVAFVPFVGIGPRKFFDLFSMRLSAGFELVRKKEDGSVFNWQRDDGYARMQMLPYSYLEKETTATKIFAQYKEMVER